MSIKVMTMVWAATEITDLSEMSVLLALADWCNDNGLCWPSIPQLAVKSRMSERNARYIISRLESSGLVKVVGKKGGRGKSNEYQISLQRLQGLSCGKPVDEKAETLQSGSVNPANHDTKPCNAIERAREESTVNEPSKAEPGEERPQTVRQDHGRKAEAIASEKAEAAWGCFSEAWQKHRASGKRLAIEDRLANRTFQALGGREWAESDGKDWHLEFIAKARELELAEFKSRGG